MNNLIHSLIAPIIITLKLRVIKFIITAAVEVIMVTKLIIILNPLRARLPFSIMNPLIIVVISNKSLVYKLTIKSKILALLYKNRNLK